MGKEKDKVSKTASVLHICGYAASTKGNFIRSLCALDKEIQSRGKKTVYLFPHHIMRMPAREWVEEMQRDGKIIYVQEEDFFKSSVQLLKILKKHTVKTVILHFADIKTYIMIALFARTKQILNFFHMMYDPRPDSKAHKLHKIIFRKSKRYILIGVSETVAEELKRNFPKHAVCAVPNGICFDRLHRVDADFPKEDAIACMAMGYNVHVKGLDLTIKAVYKLREKYNIILYVVASRGAMEEKLKIMLPDCIGEKVIPDWIRILDPTENIGTYYANASLFLAASRQEGFSYAVVEAAYCKTPVIASDIPAHVEHGLKSMLTFQSENVEAYARVLDNGIMQLSDPAYLQAVEEDARYVAKKYPIQKWVRQVAQLIETEK